MFCDFYHIVRTGGSVEEPLGGGAMRSYKCPVCSCSFTEADMEWDTAIQTGQCPKCGEVIRHFPVPVREPLMPKHLHEEDMYATALSEIELGQTRPGLWAKAYAESDGDEAKSKALYIKLRVRQENSDNADTAIQREKQARYVATKSSDGFFNKLSRGDYGLAKTYWLYGIGVGFPVSIVFSIIKSPGMIAIALLAYAAYEIPVLIGIWHSSTKYTGPKVWAVLAKVACVLGALMLLLGGLFAIFGLMNSA